MTIEGNPPHTSTITTITSTPSHTFNPKIAELLKFRIQFISDYLPVKNQSLSSLPPSSYPALFAAALGDPSPTQGPDIDWETVFQPIYQIPAKPTCKCMFDNVTVAFYLMILLIQIALQNIVNCYKFSFLKIGNKFSTTLICTIFMVTCALSL